MLKICVPVCEVRWVVRMPVSLPFPGERREAQPGHGPRTKGGSCYTLLLSTYEGGIKRPLTSWVSKVLSQPTLAHEVP